MYLFFRKETNSVWDSRNSRILPFVDNMIEIKDEELANKLIKSGYKYKKLSVSEPVKEEVIEEPTTALNYSEMTKEELKKECFKRKIEVSFRDNKADLIKKLDKQKNDLK